MGLLEREDQLAALAAARDEAAAGRGSAVLVSGEPGIGKTALLTRFAGELDGGTRLSWGNCDDLAIPRPLGPFRDIAGFPSLERALVSDAPAHGVGTSSEMLPRTLSPHAAKRRATARTARTA